MRVFASFLQSKGLYIKGPSKVWSLVIDHWSLIRPWSWMRSTMIESSSSFMVEIKNYRNFKFINNLKSFSDSLISCYVHLKLIIILDARVNYPDVCTVFYLYKQMKYSNRFSWRDSDRMLKADLWEFRPPWSAVSAPSNLSTSSHSTKTNKLQILDMMLRLVVLLAFIVRIFIVWSLGWLHDCLSSTFSLEIIKEIDLTKRVIE